MMTGNRKPLLACAALLCLSACAPELIPQKGDLARGETHEAALHTLLEGGKLNAKAERVYLDVDALPPSERVETVRLSPEQYDGMVHVTDAGRLGTPETDFSYYCENITDTAVEYTAVSEESTARETENYKLTLRNGECVRIQGKGIDAMVGTYAFNEPLSVQPAGADCHRCLETALRFYSRGIHMSGQNDTLVWEDAGMLVGESAGYVWYDSSSPLPSLINIGGAGDNYYQIILVGERSIVAVDFIYPLSMPLQQLQSEALPVIKALRYARLRGAQKREEIVPARQPSRLSKGCSHVRAVRLPAVQQKGEER